MRHCTAGVPLTTPPGSAVVYHRSSIAHCPKTGGGAQKVFHCPLPRSNAAVCRKSLECCPAICPPLLHPQLAAPCLPCSTCTGLHQTCTQRHLRRVGLACILQPMLATGGPGLHPLAHGGHGRATFMRWLQIDCAWVGWVGPIVETKNVTKERGARVLNFGLKVFKLAFRGLSCYLPSSAPSPTRCSLPSSQHMHRASSDMYTTSISVGRAWLASCSPCWPRVGLACIL